MCIAPLVLFFACGGQPHAPVPPAAAAPTDPTVATWEGGELTLSDLEAKVEGRLRSLEQQYLLDRYQLLSQVLDSAIDDALLSAAAREAGVEDVEALLQEQIYAKVEPPTDEEKRALYEEVKDQLRGASYDAVEPLIEGELTQRRLREAYRAYIADLRAEAKVDAKLPYPSLPKVSIAITDDDPILGNPDAPVSIVQFAEYQCYFCNKVAPTLRALVEDYDGKVNLVFKDFPLENHRRAKPAAVAARCAGDQGKYWEMNAILLENQSELEDEHLVNYAKRIGLDTERFESCLHSGEHDAAIRAAAAQGEAAGVQATPTFFINGTLVSGAQPYDVFKTVIEQELARQ